LSRAAWQHGSSSSSGGGGGGSGVTREKTMRQLPPQPSSQRSNGAEQSHQKYFMTDDHKSEFDKVCRTSQRSSLSQQTHAIFGCQVVRCHCVVI